MTFGFILWFSVTAFLLGFWFYTSFLLFRQKATWRAFAKKNKLRYQQNGLMDSATVSGSYDGYSISIFATDHAADDANKRKFMSTIEINLKTSVPSPCAIASGGMVNLVQEIGLTQEVRPDVAGWDASYIARSYEEEILRAFLTQARVEALSGVMKRKFTWLILVYTSETGLLRIDTSDPLETEAKLGGLLKELLDLVRVLELVQGEEKALLASKRTADPKQAVLSVKEDVVPHSLSLEED